MADEPAVELTMANLDELAQEIKSGHPELPILLLTLARRGFGVLLPDA